MLAHDNQLPPPGATQTPNEQLSKQHLDPELCQKILIRMRGEGGISVGKEEGTKKLFLSLAKKLGETETFSPADIMDELENRIYSIEKMDSFVGINANERDLFLGFLSRNGDKSPFSYDRIHFPNESSDNFNRAAHFSCDEFNKYRAVYFEVLPALKKILPTEVLAETIRSKYPPLDEQYVELEIKRARELILGIRAILAKHGVYSSNDYRNGSKFDALKSGDSPIIEIKMSHGTPYIDVYTSIGKFHATGFFPDGAIASNEKALNLIRDLCEQINLTVYEQTGREKKLKMLGCSSSAMLLAPIRNIEKLTSGGSIFIPFIFSNISDQTNRSRHQEKYFAAGNSSLQFCPIIDNDKLASNRATASRINASKPQGEIEDRAVQILTNYRDHPRDIIDLIFSQDLINQKAAPLALIALGSTGIQAIMNYDTEDFVDSDFANAMVAFGAEAPPAEFIVAKGVMQLIERKEIQGLLRYVSDDAILSAASNLHSLSDLRDIKTAVTLEVLKHCGERAIQPVASEIASLESKSAIACAAAVMEAIDTDPGERFDLYLKSLKLISDWDPKNEDLHGIRKSAIEDFLMLLARGVNSITREQMNQVADIIESRNEEFKKVYEITHLLSKLLERSGRSGLEAATKLCASGFDLEDEREKIEFDIEALPYLHGK